MKATIKQTLALANLIENGVEFNKDVHALSSNELNVLSASAKKYGYRPKPNTSSISGIISMRFYLFMQRVYDSLKVRD